MIRLIAESRYCYLEKNL